MKKLYFCARELQDYLSHIKNVDKLKLPIAESFAAELLDLDFVQNFLSSISRFEGDGEIFWTTGIDGLRLDFNFGLRLEVPEGNFRVRISDFDTGLIFFDRDISNVRLISVEKYFIRWHVEIFSDDEKVFEHTLNLEGRTVHLSFDKKGGLGDTLALLPFAQEFKKIFKCRVVISLPEFLRELAENFYPDLAQVNELNFKSYATYHLQMNFGDFPTVPADIRNYPLNRMAGAILGLNIIPPKPTFKPIAQKVCNEPYVCVGVQASTPAKGWLYPNGWEIVINYLKSLGYRVFCIDKEKFKSAGRYSVAMPANAEDFTGDFSIMERANMLYHAEFFIGLSSGLAWLADAVNCPVVMISGFTHDWHEFYTPYRVANRLVCNGCYSDIRVRAFDNFCPYQKGTTRELECQKKISPRQVINAIERLILDRNLTPPILK